MLHHAIALEELVEESERTASIDHEIFRDDLEPVHHRLLVQDVVVMRNAKTDSDSVFGKTVKTIGRHKRIFGPWGLVLPSPFENPCTFFDSLRRHFRAIGSTATLPFAGIFSLAAVITGFATTLALTGILALTSVFFLLALEERGVLKGFAAMRHRGVQRVTCSGHETGNCRADHQCFQRFAHCTAPSDLLIMF